MGQKDKNNPANCFYAFGNENKEKSRKAMLCADFDYVFGRAFQIPPPQPKIRTVQTDCPKFLYMRRLEPKRPSEEGVGQKDKNNPVNCFYAFLTLDTCF